MADFMQLAAQNEQRIGHYATRLFRIEAHLRRGERRAARAQLAGFVDELQSYRMSMEFPLQATVVGAQMGLLSGDGPLVRGRVAAAVLGAAAGWLYGNAMSMRQVQSVDDLLERVRALESEFAEQSPSPSM